MNRKIIVYGKLGTGIPNIRDSSKFEPPKVAVINVKDDKVNVYGKLNNEVRDIRYFGKPESPDDTAIVHIDQNREISVDVKKLPHKLYLVDEENPENSKEFDGSKDVEISTGNSKKELEFNNSCAFPNTGDGHTLYIAIDENKIYRWTGNSYTAIKGAEPDVINCGDAWGINKDEGELINGRIKN